MNRTQELTLNSLADSSLDGDALLLETLLRRGFLAFRDADSVWIGTGSHADDVTTLKSISGIATQVVKAHSHRLASISLLDLAGTGHMRPAARIISIKENHTMEGSCLTAVGIGGWIPNGWEQYCAMVWGAKLAVCPLAGGGHGALDTGVALLVKTLPLARVATASSCDGHALGPAVIDFFYPWDAQWCRAIFETMQVSAASSEWSWSEKRLVINLKGEASDENITGMLDDIQLSARYLMRHQVITAVSMARTKTLATFGLHAPTPAKFYDEAKHHLANVVSQHCIGELL